MLSAAKELLDVVLRRYTRSSRMKINCTSLKLSLLKSELIVFNHLRLHACIEVTSACIKGVHGCYLLSTPHFPLPRDWKVEMF